MGSDFFSIPKTSEPILIQSSNVFCDLELGSLLPVGDQLEEGAGEQELGPRVIPLQQNTPANITKLVN